MRGSIQQSSQEPSPLAAPIAVNSNAVAYRVKARSSSFPLAAKFGKATQPPHLNPENSFPDRVENPLRGPAQIDGSPPEHLPTTQDVVYLVKSLWIGRRRIKCPVRCVIQFDLLFDAPVLGTCKFAVLLQGPLLPDRLKIIAKSHSLIKPLLDPKIVAQRCPLRSTSTDIRPVPNLRSGSP